MKKFFVVFILFIVVFGSSFGVLAQGEVEVKGGPTFNNYVYQRSYAGEKDNYLHYYEELNSGHGFFMEGNYWFNPHFAMGIGFDYGKTGFNSEGGYSLDYSLTGPYTGISIVMNEQLTARLAGTYYFLDKLENGTSFEKGAGPGLLLGLRFEFPIANKVTFVGETSYRKAMISINKKLDNQGKMSDIDYIKEEISGLRITGGLSYSF